MDDEPAGVPEWVVTYGDMMSLLLTFFIMLVSLSEVEASEKYRAVMQALQNYLGYSTSSPAPAGKSYPLNSLVTRMETLGAFRSDVPKDRRGTGGIKIEAPQGTELKVFRDRDGTAITIGGELSFMPGSIVLSPEVSQIVINIAEELAGKPNKIEIRGHASPDPLPPDCPYSKMQLSYERARAVRELLIKSGIKQRRLRVGAAGDTEPIDNAGDDLTADSDRVSILVLDTYADEFVGTADAVD